MSALADRSYATRIAQKRARILAIQYNIARSQDLTAPQQGPGGNGVDDSTRAARALGQRRLWREKNPTSCASIVDGITVSVNPPSANPLVNGCCSLSATGGSLIPG